MSTCALADGSSLCPETSINGKYIYIYHVTIRYFSPIHFFLIQLVKQKSPKSNLCTRHCCADSLFTFSSKLLISTLQNVNKHYMEFGQ